MTGYCVTIEVLLDGHSPLDPRLDDPAIDERLDELADRIAEYSGIIAGDGRGWQATVTVDANNLDDARTTAQNFILTVAHHVGLPWSPVVRIEAVREDVRDAELERPTLPDLVSSTEVADVLNVSKQRVHQLASEHPDFPAPVYKLGTGSLWTRSAIERFADRWERKVGRPSMKKSA